MSRRLIADRRNFLRAGGASLLLPSLASMPLTAFANDAEKIASPPKRLCFLFFGMGVALPPEGHAAHNDWHWFPH